MPSSTPRLVPVVLLLSLCVLSPGSPWSGLLGLAPAAVTNTWSSPDHLQADPGHRHAFLEGQHLRQSSVPGIALAMAVATGRRVELQAFGSGHHDGAGGADSSLKSGASGPEHDALSEPPTDSKPGTTANPTWLQPVPTRPDGSLGPEHIRAWRDEGAVAVDGMIDAETLAAIMHDAQEVFGGAVAAVEAGNSPQDFGSSGLGAVGEFPTYRAFDKVTLNPTLIDAVQHLLGTKDVLLTQSDVWPKVGRPANVQQVANREPGRDPESLAASSRVDADSGSDSGSQPPAGRSASSAARADVDPADPESRDNQDQRMHCDYPNHSLVHPPSWNSPEVVSIIVYYSDVEDTGGSTAIVRRTGPDDAAYKGPLTKTPGADVRWPYINNRAAAERYFKHHDMDTYLFRQTLYRREQRVRFKKGTVLFYRHDVWHRGTPVLPGKLRVVHNLVFKRADATWVNGWNAGWARRMYTPEQSFEKLLANASVEQRSVLGFPRPESPFWTTSTLEAVKARYGAFHMDLAPYMAAVALKEELTVQKHEEESIREQRYEL